MQCIVINVSFLKKIKKYIKKIIIKKETKKKIIDVRILGILKIARRMEKNGREENYKNF